MIVPVNTIALLEYQTLFYAETKEQTGQGNNIPQTDSNHNHQNDNQKANGPDNSQENNQKDNQKNDNQKEGTTKGDWPT